MFPNASGVVINGGTLVNQTNRTCRGMDLLMECVATDAFHNSDELYDAPKCHPHTRVAVLEDIMQWVEESELAQDAFMLWLFGPAGTGKSAIAKRIAEIATDKDLLIAAFFFSRTSPTRSTKDRLIATLAYQLALSIPDTRTQIEDAIERDPAIFKKTIQTQIDTLLIKPFQSVPTHIVASKKLIIIDGLDECNDSKAQVAILDAISRSFPKHNLPIIFLIASRPEVDIVTSFNGKEPLKSIHRRLALDDIYRPDDDIRLFLSDKFEQIRLTHPLRSTIPISWPTQPTLDTLVKKSSGQFIYAATVVRFVESNCHRPSARLNIILGISPPGKMNPFAELDALYHHIFSSVDDIQLTLHVLSLYVADPSLGDRLRASALSPELFLSLEQGDIQVALINLASVVRYDESSGEVKILHASLVDFLSDKRRSTVFYIDMVNTCTDFFCRILQYIKGPDGIRAGDVSLLYTTLELRQWIPKGQGRSAILNFDLDAFLEASIIYYYKDPNIFHYWPSSPISSTFDFWMEVLAEAVHEDEDQKEALYRCNESFESRAQKYQSDWRLQLLLTLIAASSGPHYLSRLTDYEIPPCRCADILLEMDDHDLHLVDQDALDLRHAYQGSYSTDMNVIMSRYVDGDRCATAALHCMRFLSNPPFRKYSGRNDSPETGLTYAERIATCAKALDMLCPLLQVANTSPDLVQFITNRDIHPAVRKDLSVCSYDLSWVDAYILAFLSRASVCVNWRIISVIQRLGRTGQPPSESELERNHGIVDWEAERELILQRLDQCCSKSTFGRHRHGYYLRFC
ncbi:hypothetical protein BYT27DRAFT_7187242 [Phlegmacium glaucopus]|nr:hypothetical protein BYT27DRAFT_7187242 [Phlegmacium glaucopus]